MASAANFNTLQNEGCKLHIVSVSHLANLQAEIENRPNKDLASSMLEKMKRLSLTDYSNEMPRNLQVLLQQNKTSKN